MTEELSIMDISKAEKAQAHLIQAYPTLSHLFQTVGPLALCPRHNVPVAEALVRIIIGQMLSRFAAASIYRRARTEAQNTGCRGTWELDREVLYSLGISARKVRAIKTFGNKYDADPKFFEAWRHLPYKKLREVVSQFWGIGSWSADILAIFYFGNPDVLPGTDKSICRAVELLQANEVLPTRFDPNLATPYRSYLALYLWHILDGTSRAGPI